MKREWKKSEKHLYLPSDKPELLEVPKQKFFMISGKGNPNEEDYSNRIGVLYSLAYTVRMMPKNGFIPEGYEEYTVYPLEGVWDMTEKGRAQEKLAKEELLYTIMIRQPEFVTSEIAQKAFETVRRKKPSPLLEEVSFGEQEDGLCVQILHKGSYDDEPADFEKMRIYIEENHLKLRALVHREIYIKAVKGNMSEEDKKTLKTVLRYRVSR